MLIGLKMETYCIIIPVYNNANAIGSVIDGCLKQSKNVIVIDDGSTDGTTEIIQSKDVLHHKLKINQGKGAALKAGFAIAQEKNYTYAITIDGDGQHYPTDIPRFIEHSQKHPGSLIIGERRFSENVTNASKIGLFFSNFFFRAATFRKAVDTQSGYRLYLVDSVSSLSLSANAYDFEIEVLIKSYWKGIPIEVLPIEVFYAKPEERISHFQVRRDGWKGTKVYIRLLFMAPFKLPIYFFKYNKKRESHQ